MNNNKRLVFYSHPLESVRYLFKHKALKIIDFHSLMDFAFHVFVCKRMNGKPRKMSHMLIFSGYVISIRLYYNQLLRISVTFV